jgi:hypothetical protein
MAIEKRKDLISKNFSLSFNQKFPGQPQGFTLLVTDTQNDSYVLTAVTITPRAKLIALLLRRIANENGKPGWKFDAEFDTDANRGIITG